MGNLNYQYVPTLLEDEVLVENGWIMRGRIRVEDVANTIDTAVAMQVGLASTSQLFQLGLSVDANDNTIFALHNGSNFTSVSGSVEGVGYHLYEIVYDPDTQTIDLFVDGDELINNFAGRNYANLRQVLFGANSGGGTGTGYFNMVEFVVLPEPGGIILLFSLLLPILSLRPRRRRNYQADLSGD